MHRCSRWFSRCRTPWAFRSRSTLTSYGAHALFSVPTGDGSTSAGTPTTAGVAALVASAGEDAASEKQIAEPLDANEVFQVTRASVSGIESTPCPTCFPGLANAEWNLQYGYGRPNVYKAMKAVHEGDIPPTAGRRGRDARPEQGYLHAGGSGAGHFVKMIHNGIEYGMMQAIAEGLDILKHAGSPRLPEELRLAIDVADTAEVWRRGSVITSWLLDLTAAALAEDAELAAYSGHVEDSGEGRWAVQAAVEEAVPAEVLTSALYARFRSRQEHTFAEKVLSAMRKGFGGHMESSKP